VQAAPAASQRRHCSARVWGTVPDQAPRLAVRVCPSRAVPVTAGSALLAGATAATGAVGELSAELDPPPLLAATRRRMREPTSAVVSR
jgi:hypothetical protein